MTQLQFDRWREFAMAMAERGFADRTAARNTKRADEVRQFFDCVTFEAEQDGKLPDWRSWDEGVQDEGGQFEGICLVSYFTEWSEGLPGYWKLSDYHYEHWRFRDELACCLRAGMDVACEPSAGVLGFTAGDIRRMFPIRIPDYVAAFEPEMLLADDREPLWL